MSTESRINAIDDRLATIGGTRATNLQPLYANRFPESSNMLSKKVQMSTKDVTDPQNPITIDEEFQVIPGNFSPTKLANSGGNRWILPFGASGYGMKFHFPYGENRNMIYITFCKRASDYVDGWMDYQQSVDVAWTNAAITYASRMPSNVGDSRTKNFASDQFLTYNELVLWANFKGLGPSSIASDTQGKVYFKLQFVDNPSAIEVGTGGFTQPYIPPITPVTPTIPAMPGTLETDAITRAINDIRNN